MGKQAVDDVEQARRIVEKRESDVAMEDKGPKKTAAKEALKVAKAAQRKAREKVQVTSKAVETTVKEAAKVATASAGIKSEKPKGSKEQGKLVVAEQEEANEAQKAAREVEGAEQTKTNAKTVAIKAGNDEDAAQQKVADITKKANEEQSK